MRETTTPAPYLTPIGTAVIVTLENGAEHRMVVSQREAPGAMGTAMHGPTFHAHIRPGGYSVMWGGRTSPGLVSVTLAPADVAHADYPHNPGALYDCPACEASCHCTPGATECVFEGPHNGSAA